VQKQPEDTRYVGTFKIDAEKNPKVMVLTLETNPWNDKKDFRLQAIYALDGATFKLCLSLPNDDNRDLIPAEFSANYGSKPSLSTFKREPASGKGKEMKR